MTPLQIKNLIKKTLDEHKAENIVSINVNKLTSVTDYIVVCSANSTRQVKALAEHVMVACKHQGIQPLGHEGTDGSDEWALIDLGDVVVHVMLETARTFYDLERLWNKSNAKTSKARATLKEKSQDQDFEES